MNWTLVALLAIPAIMMGLLSVKGHTRGIEPYLWIILAVFATLVIARTAGSRYLLHGLAVGVTWGVLNGLTAATLFSVYSRNNPEIMRMMQSDGRTASPALFVMSAPLIGLVTGVVLGLLCWGAARLIPAAPPIDPTTATADAPPDRA